MANKFFHTRWSAPAPVPGDILSLLGLYSPGIFEPPGAVPDVPVPLEDLPGWTKKPGGFPGKGQVKNGKLGTAAGVDTAYVVEAGPTNDNKAQASIYDLATQQGWVAPRLIDELNFVGTTFIPKATSHRYWAIRSITVQAVSQVNWAQAEVELRETPGGPDVATGGTASATTSWNIGSNPPSMAFDNNNATWWAGGNNSQPNTRLIYDLGVGVSKAIQQVMLRARADAPEQATTKFALEYSDNGTTWTVQQIFTTAVTWTAGSVQAFDTVDMLRADKVVAGVKTMLGEVVVSMEEGHSFGGIVKGNRYYITHQGEVVGGPYYINSGSVSDTTGLVLSGPASEGWIDDFLNDDADAPELPEYNIYRFHILQNNRGDRWTGLGNIQMKESIGGPALLYPTMPVSADNAGAGAAANAIDGSLATKWGPTASTGVITFTLDQGADPKHLVYSHTHSVSEQPVRWKLDRYNGQTGAWEDWWIEEGYPGVKNAQIPYTFNKHDPSVPGYQRWRFRALTTNGGWPLLRELEFFENGNTIDITAPAANTTDVGGFPLSHRWSIDYESGTAALALFDDSTATALGFGAAAPNAWMGWRFDTQKVLTGFRATAVGGFGGNDGGPTSFVIEYFDPVTGLWVIKDTFSGIVWSGVETKLFALS
jgi:hypothetical protein